MSERILAEWTVESLAARLGGEVVGRGDLVIRGVSSLRDAADDQITFAVDGQRAGDFAGSRAAALLISRRLPVPEFDHGARAVIRIDDAEQAMIDLLEMFSAAAETAHAPGAHPSAAIDPSAVVDPAASIGPHVSVEAGATIEAGVVLHAGARIGRGARIGAGSVIRHNAVIGDGCIVGRNCILHNGVSIGADGFNYRPAPDGRGLRKVPHIGNVVLEDEVEIGANSCVDRGKFGPTTIGAGTKIDNLVQVGHNCRIGRCVVIAGVTAIAGSVEIGDGAMIGGQVGIAEHTIISPGAKICGGAGVMNDVRAEEPVFGLPAQPLKQAMRQVVLLKKMKVWMQEIDRRLNDVDR